MNHKFKYFAVIFSAFCAISTVNAAKNNPSPEFEKAALEYVNSLDPNKPSDCLGVVQTELTSMQLNMKAHNPNGFGYIESDTTKELYKKSQKLKKACQKIRHFQGMPRQKYLEIDNAWIPWMIRTGWNKKEGWTAYSRAHQKN